MRLPGDDSAQNGAEVFPLDLKSGKNRRRRCAARGRRFSRLQCSSGSCGDLGVRLCSPLRTAELKPLVQCAVHTAPPRKFLQPRCKVPSFDSPLLCLPFFPLCSRIYKFFEGEFVDEVSEKADVAREWRSGLSSARLRLRVSALL